MSNFKKILETVIIINLQLTQQTTRKMKMNKKSMKNKQFYSPDYLAKMHKLSKIFIRCFVIINILLHKIKTIFVNQIKKKSLINLPIMCANS